ncbi:hypothetical protein Aph01nite_39770 [Acrocarpospora phusangensis]|uniref:Uncharacterized protein n=1 Tax=Acrocarpospora phusangensis TaxID=1070424 RepID=A0A919UPG8_9ACTN|nr:hypothetical protein Aph01nite_39770 [Acrocarpospora phusangensis]
MLDRPRVAPGGLCDRVALLDVRTSPNRAIFWSGVDAAYAEELARTLGGETIGAVMSLRGVVLPPSAPGEEAEDAWAMLSARFAVACSGEVRVILPMDYDLATLNFWTLIERPLLERNPRVTRIIRIEAPTRITVTIFER